MQVAEKCSVRPAKTSKTATTHHRRMRNLCVDQRVLEGPDQATTEIVYTLDVSFYARDFHQLLLAFAFDADVFVADAHALVHANVRSASESDHVFMIYSLIALMRPL